MKPWILGMWMMAAVCLGFPAASQAEDALDEARKAAEAWLTLIDAAKYNEAWKQGSGILRRVPQKPWVTMTGAVLDPLGPLASREFLSSVFTHTIPGAPPGEYVIVKFKTKYAYAKGQETVTLIKGQSGAWKTAEHTIGRTYGLSD